MKTNTAKSDFLDDVVDEMGDGKGSSEYGADMDAEDSEGDDDESAVEDRIMAFKQFRKAMTAGDDAKGAEALKAFISTCS